MTRPSCRVLSFRRVNDDRDPFFPSVPTDAFRRQMARLAASHGVLTVDAMVQRMKSGTLRGHAIAVTFDDGYRDTLTHAAPILAHYGVPATLFLSTGFVGAGQFPWFDDLALAFKLTERKDVRLADGRRWPLTNERQRLRALSRSLSHFRRVADDERRAQLERLLGRLGAPDRHELKNRMLSWNDVDALAGLGFAFGAHTVNHPVLSRVTPERARTEIVGAKAMIEAALGRPVTAFAYPCGRPRDYTATVTQLVRDAGFTCAFTGRDGVNAVDGDLFALRRTRHWSDSPALAGA